MREFQRESLCHDPIHGYIPFVSEPFVQGKICERDVIDHPWVQRLRQIHQLQTAWWVYPTAEHTRFQHVIGAMHLASRCVAALYDSLREVDPDTPSRGYVECLMRMAALLHDVGHGPFGHFFDAHFLADYDLTHETLGSQIIREELGEMLSQIRRCPTAALEPTEHLDPDQIAFLITRPKESQLDPGPRWLTMLRSLFCGIYTVDNLDFVLRDAFMSGYSERSFDLDRLLHYSFFSPQGLTIHRRGIDALVRFIRVRGELFRAIYFHRTVRSIDLTLADLFQDSKAYLFDKDPRFHLDEYLHFTEWSLLVDVSRWPSSADARKRELGAHWARFLTRQLDWVIATERNLVFAAADSEESSIFSDAALVERSLRKKLGADGNDLPLRVDVPRHIHRPHTRLPTKGQNFLLNPANGETRPLTDDQLFRQLPVSQRIGRVYVRKETPASTIAAIAAALDSLIGPGSGDDLTNM